MKAKHLVIYALLTCLFIVFSQSAEVSNASSPISDRFPISTISNAPTHAGELNPSVAYNSGFMNVYLVVWDQLNADSSASVVYGQFVDSGGTLNGVKCSISPLGGYNQYPDVAYNSTNDQFLVVYERAGGIYGQILTNTGGIVGTEITSLWRAVLLSSGRRRLTAPPPTNTWWPTRPSWAQAEVSRRKPSMPMALSQAASCQSPGLC